MLPRAYTPIFRARVSTGPGCLVRGHLYEAALEDGWALVLGGCGSWFRPRANLFVPANLAARLLLARANNPGK